jgi:hypothetical protein
MEVNSGIVCLSLAGTLHRRPLGRRRGEGVGITALGEKTPNRARARLSPAGNVAHPDIAITAIYQKAVVLPPSHELV